MCGDAVRLGVMAYDMLHPWHHARIAELPDLDDGMRAAPPDCPLIVMEHPVRGRPAVSQMAVMPPAKGATRIDCVLYT